MGAAHNKNRAERGCVQSGFLRPHGLFSFPNGAGLRFPEAPRREREISKAGRTVSAALRAEYCSLLFHQYMNMQFVRFHYMFYYYMLILLPLY